MSYVNIAAYKFVTFDNTAEVRPAFKAVCAELNLRGTILLTPEGINLFLSGSRSSIERFLAWLRVDPRFADIVVKESLSASPSHSRMLVKLKREVITMRMALVRPEEGRAPCVAPRTLKRWLDQGRVDDAGRPVVLMDTRNTYEIAGGTFRHTIDPRIERFTQFPAVAAAHREQLKHKTVVSFCTGGIRCEKAAIHMKEIGYESVYQLDGGILKYFEECGGEHYDGDCFVFDQRTKLNPNLEPSDAPPPPQRPASSEFEAHAQAALEGAVDVCNNNVL